MQSTKGGSYRSSSALIGKLIGSLIGVLNRICMDVSPIAHDSNCMHRGTIRRSTLTWLHDVQRIRILLVDRPSRRADFRLNPLYERFKRPELKKLASPNLSRPQFQLLRGEAA